MPGKPARVKRKHANEIPFREQIHCLADEMEEPLRLAADFVSALHLIGFGLESIKDKDASQPVLAIAEALSEKLCAIKQRWHAIYNALEEVAQ